ncbi:MAG TPA: hypothetical protein VFY06_11055 [Verrucomicrobiae bacterium]|nr:hypothetical protein [Verrucomicrobiae bacterium]
MKLKQIVTQMLAEQCMPTLHVVGVTLTLLLPMCVFADVATEAWVQRYSQETGFSSAGCDQVLVDSSSNIVVAGYAFEETGSDILTTKHSSSGSVVWVNTTISPIPLFIEMAGNQTVVTWQNSAFELQAAPSVAGTYTNIPSATSPYTNPITGAQQFYRLKFNAN